MSVSHPTPWVDRLGSVASAACAVHCLALAAAPALLAALGMGAAMGETLEWGFFTVAMVLAAVAGHAAFRSRRDRRLVMGFGAGMLVLTVGRLTEVVGVQGGVVLALTGGALLVGSHVMSLRRAHPHCEVGCS